MCTWVSFEVRQAGKTVSALTSTVSWFVSASVGLENDVSGDKYCLNGFVSASVGLENCVSVDKYCLNGFVSASGRLEEKRTCQR